MINFTYSRAGDVADAVRQIADDPAARLVAGGVAHKPWRDAEAEGRLNGARVDRESFAAAADIVLRQARGFGHNDFKIELARRTIMRALTQAARSTPQSQSDKRIR